MGNFKESIELSFGKFIDIEKPDSVTVIGNGTVIITDFLSFKWVSYLNWFMMKNSVWDESKKLKDNSIRGIRRMNGKLNIFICLSPLDIIEGVDDKTSPMHYFMKILDFLLRPFIGDIHVIILYTGYSSDSELIRISEMGYIRTMKRAKIKLKHMIETSNDYDNYKVHIDGTRYGINFNINNNKFVKKYYYLKLIPWYTKVDLPKKSHESIKEKFEQEKKKSTILANYYKHNSLGEDSDESLK